MTPQEAEEAKRQFSLIGNLIQQGKPEQAETLTKDILKRFPKEPNFLRLLAVCLIKQKRFCDAEQPLKQLVKLDPTTAENHELYGSVLLELEKFKHSEKSLREALSLNSGLALTYPKLSRALNCQGKREAASAVMKDMLLLDHNAGKIIEAARARMGGNLLDAGKILQQVLRSNSKNIIALERFGDLELEVKRPQNAATLFQEAIRVSPDFAAAWYGLGQALIELSLYRDALNATKKALSMDPYNIEWISHLADIQVKWGKEEDAVVTYEKAIELQPENPQWRLALANTLKTIGKTDAAVDVMKKAAVTSPHEGSIYWNLANLKTFAFGKSDISHMERELERDDLTHSSRTSFNYALGKAYEDAKNYDQAFYRYQLGADQENSVANYDAASIEQAIDLSISTFTREFFEQRQNYGSDDTSPIFIVGIPRSGSTLIEQVLASHSKVDGTMELRELPRIARDAWRMRTTEEAYPTSLNELTSEEMRSLGQSYLERTMPYRGNATHFTDKALPNFMHIGLMQLILPKCKIIDARRHPLDSCLSTYKQLFGKGSDYSYNMTNIAHYYCEYDRLMRHWNEVLPNRILRVQYEDHVSDQEEEAKRILDYCQLDWEENVLSFYDNQRAVRTVSSEQVRQPIYDKSVNTWKKYEKHLDPLVEGLKHVLDQMPENLERPNDLRR